MRFRGFRHAFRPFGFGRRFGHSFGPFDFRFDWQRSSGWPSAAHLGGRARRRGRRASLLWLRRYRAELEEELRDVEDDLRELERELAKEQPQEAQRPS